MIWQNFLHMFAIASTSSKSALTLSNGDVLAVRPFSSAKDQEKLTKLCEDVWNGTDYLPHVAKSFEEDPKCDFAVLEDESTGELIGAGNIRVFDDRGDIYWIESIRVSSKFKGRGIATALMKDICRRCKEAGGKEILTCTINSNDAMIKVFGKEGIEMACLSSIQFTSFANLKTLPGWAAGDTDVPSQNILKALGVEHRIPSEAKSREWSVIQTEDELKYALDILKQNGLCGQLPGVGKLLWMSTELRNSIKKGLVRVCWRSSLDSANGRIPVLMALVKESAIQSLRSQYVCSIVATNELDFDSAVWEACKSELVEHMGGNPAFSVVVDGLGRPDSESSTSPTLPLSDGTRFVIYGCEHR